MAVQLQWSLDRTAASAISVATGVLQASARDNVQPLALLACEKFGNTIAMCQETMLKIEHFVVPTPEPLTISFLKSTVGFFPDDSTTQLGQSMAGVRFLALVAPMICTMGPDRAATTIQATLANTTTDATLLPSIRNIRDLLISIEPRCHRSGFADQLTSWSIFLRKITAGPTERLDGVPNAEGVEALVNALRRLHRLGTDDVSEVTVRTKECASWAIAFIKWCLGLPPSIVCEGEDGRSIVQEHGGISVLIPKDKTEKFQVTVYSSIIGGPSELVFPLTTLCTPQLTMVSLETFSKHRMDSFGNNDLATRAVDQALPYALYEIGQNLEIRSEDQLMWAHRIYMTPVDEVVSSLKTHPFPGNRSIIEIYYLMFGRRINLKNIDNELRLGDLPLMSLYNRELKKECSCRSCKPVQITRLHCMVDDFQRNFSDLVMEIVTLSFFDSPESLQVWLGYEEQGYKMEHVRDVICKKLFETDNVGAPGVYCTAPELHQWPLDLVGHVFNGSRPIASSFKGQTVWSALYDSPFVPQQGYLRLRWAPGLLIHQKDTYKVARSAWERTHQGCHIHIPSDLVSARLNLFTKTTLTWYVSPGTDHLDVSLGVRDTATTIKTFNPAKIFEAYPHCFVLDTCCHSADARLEAPDKFCKLASPLFPFPRPADFEMAESMTATSEDQDAAVERKAWSSLDGPGGLRSDGFVGSSELSSDPEGVHQHARLESLIVVPVDGADHLRFLALVGLAIHSSLQFRVLVRKTACLACSLDTCRKIGATHLVL